MENLSLVEFYLRSCEEFEKVYGKESIILLQNGDFYEMYGLIWPVKRGKAEIARDILHMNMAKVTTRKPFTAENPLLFVGFPRYAVDEHLGKFLRAGYTVGVYDQFPVAAKGNGKHTFIRKQTHVYSPSTFIDDTLPDANSVMAFEFSEFKSAITKKMYKKVHICHVDLCSGKVSVCEVYDTATDPGKAESELYRLVHTLNPTEIISGSNLGPGSALEKQVIVKEIHSQYRKSAFQIEFFKKIFPHDPTAIASLDHYQLCIPTFIQAVQFAYERDKRIVSRVQKPSVITFDDVLILNNDSIYQINLIPSVPGEKSLLEIIDKCKTDMGRRLLRERLLSPTTNVNVLNARYDSITRMMPVWEQFSEPLSGILDIEKILGKMVQGTLHPYGLANFIECLPNITETLQLAKEHALLDELSCANQGFSEALLRARPEAALGTFLASEGTAGSKTSVQKSTITNDFAAMQADLEGYFDLDIAKKTKLYNIKESFFIPGVNDHLDSLEIQKVALQERLSKIAKDLDCKVDQTEKEGWYLTMTLKKWQKSPIKEDPDYHVTKLTSTVKLRSTETDEISNTLAGLQEKTAEIVASEYSKTVGYFCETYNGLLTQVAQVVAELDFVFAASKCANLFGYTRPIIGDNQASKEPFLDILGIRHPIVERISEEEEFVTNDIQIGKPESGTGSLIYGLNMSGKSCLLKSIGCAVVMAQAGMFVAAAKMTYSPFKSVLSKMTIRDNLSKGQSTFFVEMLEVKSMLSRADSNTLVLSDELCSSTESTSGHAIVAATLAELSKRRVKFFFSTHLHDLQKLAIVKDNPTIKIFHFKVSIRDKKIILDRKLAPGGLSELYGLEVAEAIGLPPDFMRQAFSIRDTLTGSKTAILSTKTSNYNSAVPVDACERCGANVDLHTHHLQHQKDADPKTGLINNKFHKDAKFNLKILCQKCHDHVHHGQ